MLMLNCYWRMKMTPLPQKDVTRIVSLLLLMMIGGSRRIVAEVTLAADIVSRAEMRPPNSKTAVTTEILPTLLVLAEQ